MHVLCCTLFLLLIGQSTCQPPPYKELAASARYVINSATWGVIGTISTIPQLTGRPFTNIISIVDGPYGNGTGIPYMYISNLDVSAKDILANSTVSLSVSGAVFGYCQSVGWDPEDPRCARLTLTGKIIKVSGSEKDYALKWLFERHPAMKEWDVLAHDFYPVKLDIDSIWFLDFFGGINNLDIKEYLAVKPSI